MDESPRILDEIRIGMDVAGKYRIEALLGHGGMGAVYAARHLATGRRVALKFLLANQTDLRLRMQREAMAMGALTHPNVVGVFDVGEHDDTVFLVMELLVGKSLHDYVEGRILEPKEAIALVMPAMQGVEAAHRAGFVHRDLKPENLFVLLDEHGVAYDTKVLDFGIARPLASRGDVSITRSGTIVGTPRYMAPEQIRGGKEVGPETDVWALGLILYELLVGRTPYEAQSYESLILEIATQPTPSPRLFATGIDEALANTILRALEKKPSDRFPSVMEFARALEPFADGVKFVVPRGVQVASEEIAMAMHAPFADAPTGVAEPRASTGATRPLGARPVATPRTDPLAPSAPVDDPSPPVPAEPPTPPRARRRATVAIGIAALVMVVSIVALAVRRTSNVSVPPAATPPPPAAAPANASPPPSPVPSVVPEPSSGPVAHPLDESVAPPTATDQTPRRRGATRAEPELPPPSAPSNTNAAGAPHEARGRAGTIRADDF